MSQVRLASDTGQQKAARCAQPAEIADTIGICILTGSDRQAMDDRIFVPKVVYHHDH
jgi:hypothetical protein